MRHKVLDVAGRHGLARNQHEGRGAEHADGREVGQRIGQIRVGRHVSAQFRSECQRYQASLFLRRADQQFIAEGVAKKINGVTFDGDPFKRVNYVESHDNAGMDGRIPARPCSPAATACA